MSKKVLDFQSSTEVYAKPNPLNNERKFLPDKKKIQIQKIDNREYHTKQLFHAVQHGYTNVFKTLHYKIWYDRLNLLDEKNNYSLLHYACLENHTEIVVFLLKYKADINLYGAKGIRPIHLASQKGNVNIVELLCNQRGIQIDAVDDKGQTSLHIACRRGHIDVVKVLLEYKASVNKLELDKISVMHHPVRRNDVDMIKILLLYGTPLNIRNNNGQTPLMIAAIEGHSDLFSSLLNEAKKGGLRLNEILNEKDNDGLSCLSHATQNENSEVIQLCMNNGADIESRQVDGKTVFHTAAITGYVGLYNILENGFHNLDVTDYELNTPLHYAIINKNIEMVRLLLKKGACANICNKHFQTPIILACSEIAQSKNSSEIIKILHVANADLKIRDFEMKTFFHYLVEKENIEMINYFINNLNQPILSDLINSQDDSDNSSLHHAARIGNVKICSILLSAGADPILFGSNDSLPLHVATINGHLECVKVLLEASQTTSYYRDGNENSAINLAAEHGRHEIFIHLVEIGKDRLSKDEYGRNTLMFASKSGCLPIVQMLLNEEINVNLFDQMKTTALHHASGGGHLDVVELLWKHGANMSEDIFGQSELDIAIINEHWHIVRFFLNDNNWKRVMKFRHRNGHGHIKLLIKMNEQITMELLDKCITENTTNKMDSNYEVKYWFGLLDSGPDDPASVSSRYLALKSMAEYKKLNLLKHPLAEKLLDCKWKKFGLAFYLIDFILYLMFLISITIYMTVNKPLNDNDTFSSSTGCKATSSSVVVSKSTASNELIFLNILVYCLVSGQLLLQLIKLFSQKHRFFLDIWNYIFIVCDILVFFFIKNPSQLPCLYEWQFGPGLIFVAWFLLLYYLQYIPVIGIQVMMFERVLISIIKVISIFFCLFVGFGIGFYIINSTQDPFKYPGLAIIKSFGMMIGELEIVSYFITGKTNYASVSYAIIVLFMIIMNITLFNLMIGLAVGDIEKIASAASLETIKLRVDFVWEVESKLPKRFQRYLFISELLDHSRNIKKTKWYHKFYNYRSKNHNLPSHKTMMSPSDIKMETI